eukprot:3886085-Prymnesium_polylepis.1
MAVAHGGVDGVRHVGVAAPRAVLLVVRDVAFEVASNEAHARGLALELEDALVEHVAALDLATELIEHRLALGERCPGQWRKARRSTSSALRRELPWHTRQRQ